MKNLDRAIDLAEEHCGTPFWEARDELEATRVKTRAFDLLWERAHTVIATFEALGKTRSVPEQLTLHKRCESAMVALKETLDETPEDESTLTQHPAPQSAPVGVDLDKVAAHLAEHGGDFDALILLVQESALAQQPAAVECPHRTRCDCLAACKYGYAGDGATQHQEPKS